MWFQERMGVELGKVNTGNYFEELCYKGEKKNGAVNGGKWNEERFSWRRMLFLKWEK